MDQRQTTEAELYERAFPPRDLAYYLGTLLNLPVEDIPTVEDLEREKGLIGLPTREQSNRQAGQDLLDWAAQAFGLGSILRGSAAGRQQDLMSKSRGVETFGKEMMETSRRAYPKKWMEQRAEEWRRPDEPETGMERGRQSYQSIQGGKLAPGEMPAWRAEESLPSDVVKRGPLWSRQETTTGRPGWDSDVYSLGEMVELPGGRKVQYVVVPSTRAYHVGLYDGENLSLVDSMTSVGEALAKARQMQNRLALAAKDFERFDWQTPRTVRFPWERGRARELEPYGPPNPQWPWSYESPPASGRWGQ